MTRRSGRHGVDPSSPLVDLELVFADDEFIDAIAAGPSGGTGPRTPVNPIGVLPAAAGRGALLAVDPLTELFESWRDELAVVPIPPPPATLHAAAAVQQGNPPPRRSLRPALSIAVAIAALLAGSATIGSRNATPDSALWGITKVVWPDRAQSVASRDNARHALDQAESAIKAGLAQEAQLALLRATVELGNVDEVDGRDGMQQRVADLWRQAAPPELAGTLPSTDAASSTAVTTAATTNPPTSAAAVAPSQVDLVAESAPPTAAVEAAPSVPAPDQIVGYAVADPATAPAVDPGTDIAPSSGAQLNSGSPDLAVPPAVPPAAPTEPLPATSVPAEPVVPSEPSALPTPEVPVQSTPDSPSTDPSTFASTEQAPAPTPPTADTNGPTSEGTVPAEQSSSAKQQESLVQSDQSTTTADTAVAG